jgi:N-acetylneuraminic acid mutarotase
MGNGRYQFDACVISGEIYVTGGFDNAPLSCVEKYTPSSDTWSAVAPLPAARHIHAAVAVGSVMYVLGGRDGEDTVASVFKVDTTQGTWSQVAPMPTVRHALAACTIGSDIYVFGGFDGHHQIQNSVFKFDTEADEWSTLAPMPHACSFHSASVLDSLVYIVGAGAIGRDVLCFDPTSGVWSTLAPTSIRRKTGASFVVGGCLHAAGGKTTAFASSVERYDVASNTWTAVANMLEGRTQVSAVTIGSAGPAAGEQDLFDSLIAKASSRHQ